jgi:protein O-mannosyl-transferase
MEYMNSLKPDRLKNMATSKPSEPSKNTDSHGAIAGICVLLGVAVLLVFGQTLRHEFINYDDGPYVYDNTHIVKGLTLTGIVWAFTHSQAGFWHPLTWISHMLDCQLYGLSAGGHHLTNVLLHAATAILLFLVLRRMMRLRSDASSPQAGFRSNQNIGTAATPAGTLWPSAFVAAVFAIHPLRVESVAWVAERKDVLSGLFFMLTLLMYARYVEKSKVQSPKSKVFYGLMLLFFALGLMSKPMLVTVPFVLLLLDYWPLGRVTGGEWRVTGDKNSDSQLPGATKRSEGGSTFNHLLLEKLPLFLLAIAAGFIAFLTQKSYGAVAALEGFPLGSRLANSLMSYVAYILKMFWPDNLAIFYPYPVTVPTWEIAVAGTLLLFITMQAVMFARRRPYLLVGWLWYLGMLVPVIGLVQSGEQARADRFTYLPQIGLYLVVAWAVKDLFPSWRLRRQAFGIAAGIVIVALMVGAAKQTSYWRNSESLWTHSLACTSRNYVGHNNLGIVFAGRGQSAQAMDHYQKALEILPNFAEAHYNLGIVLADQGRYIEALEHYRRALEIRPNYAEAHYNLGNLLAGQGQIAEAIEHFQRALEIKPDFAEAHYNLGAALARQGRNLEAINHYQQVIEIKPDFPGVHYNLGVVLAAQGFNGEAIPHFQKALENKPDNADAHNNLGILLAQQGQSAEAIRHFKKAIELQPDYADAYSSMGNVLADQGHLAEATTYYQKAVEINPDFAAAHYNLGNALALQARYAEAIGHFQKALQLRPDDAKARRSLDAALGLLNQSTRETGKQPHP